MNRLKKLTIILMGIDVAIIGLLFIIGLVFPNRSFMQIGFIFPMFGFMMLPFVGLLFILSFLVDYFSQSKNKYSKAESRFLPDKELIIDTGDLSFLFLVNAELYASFVDEDWDLEQDLIPHIQTQQTVGHILMYTLNADLPLDKWTIHVYINREKPAKNYMKKARNYIEVSTHKLYFIDYTCLTMAAQFADELIPNKLCEPYVIELENGQYQVDTYLYTDSENGNKLNKQEDMAVYFTLISKHPSTENHKIDWA